MKWKLIDGSVLFTILFASLLGGFVRFWPVLLSNFPLNDGGLFYQMTEDILNNHFVLPMYTSYNGGMIPFAYPPLPLYLMALLQRALHISVIDQLHFLPVIFSTLCIPALYFLGKNITGSKVRSIFAVVAYALIPQSYLWLIMGGGVTRALGILFAILSMIFVWKMFKEPRLSNLIWAIIFSSLTIYCHLGYAWFLFLTSALNLIKFGFTKKRVLYGVLTAIGVLILSAPWWVSIIQRYGAALFIDAFQAGNFLDFSVIFFSFTGEPFVSIIAVIALLGLLAEIARKRFFLFFWLLLIAVLSARGGPRLAAIPASILFGSGITWIVVPGFARNTKLITEDNPSFVEIIQARIIKLLFGVILFFAFFSALVIPLLGLAETRSLSPDERQAMDWVYNNTTSTNQFALLTGQEWITDPQSEWFPALSGRVSITTVQGSEWLPEQGYSRQIERYNELQACADKDYSCIFTWSEKNEMSFAYLAVAKKHGGSSGVGQAVIDSMVSSDYLQLVFNNPGVSIFQIVNHP